MKSLILASMLLFTLSLHGQTTVVVTGKINVTSSAIVSWTVSSGATSYNIYRGPSGGPYVQIVTGVTGASYPDSTVAPKTRYCYEVTAVNGSGESSKSSPEACGSIP